jgi:hypothetical protein
MRMSEKISRLKKTALFMIIQTIFALICIGYSVSVLGWNNGYPFWMNDYPLTYIPFTGWIISACIMFYYMFTLSKDDEKDLE